MKIQIVPVSVWTPSGPQSATVFEVRYINYYGPNAVADCHLLSAGGVEVAALGIVPATAEQCAAWTDDDKFAGVLAVNAGLTPAPAE